MSRFHTSQDNTLPHKPKDKDVSYLTYNMSNNNAGSMSDSFSSPRQSEKKETRMIEMQQKNMQPDQERLN